MFISVLKIIFPRREIYFYVLKIYFSVLKTLFHALKILSSRCKDTFFFRFYQIYRAEITKDSLSFDQK